MALKDKLNYRVGGEGDEQLSEGINKLRRYVAELPKGAKFAWAIAISVPDFDEHRSRERAEAAAKERQRGLFEEQQEAFRNREQIGRPALEDQVERITCASCNGRGCDERQVPCAMCEGVGTVLLPVAGDAASNGNGAQASATDEPAEGEDPLAEGEEA